MRWPTSSARNLHSSYQKVDSPRINVLEKRDPFLEVLENSDEDSDT